MSVTLTPSTTRTSSPSTAVPKAFAVAGAVLAGNAAVLAPQLFFNSDPYSEIAGTTAHLVHYVLWTAALIALGQLFPRLWAARDGGRVPTSVLTIAAVGASLDACSRFVQAFVNPYLHRHDPSLLDSTPDAILLVPLLATGVVAMVGGAAVGVLAWRRGLVGLPAAALIVLGSLAIPVVGPMSNLLLGVGLIWLGFRGVAMRAA